MGSLVNLQTVGTVLGRQGPIIVRKLRCTKGLSCFCPPATEGSSFNTEQICQVCRYEEERHPLFEEARRREMEELNRGNFDFEGRLGLEQPCAPPPVCARRVFFVSQPRLGSAPLRHMVRYTSPRPDDHLGHAMLRGDTVLLGTTHGTDTTILSASTYPIANKPPPTRASDGANSWHGVCS